MAQLLRPASMALPIKSCDGSAQFGVLNLSPTAQAVKHHSANVWIVLVVLDGGLAAFADAARPT
jgi:hypothetical protein